MQTEMRRCPGCGALSPSSARFCGSCGVSLDVQPMPPSAKPPTNPATLGCIGCCGLIVFLVVIGAIMSALSPPDATDSISAPVETYSQPQQPGTSGTTTSGTTVLQSGAPEGCFVAATKEAFDRLNKLCVAKDTVGVSQMMAAGLVVVVPSGTRVLVIDHAFAVREVRILEGQYAGQSGWVAYEFVVEQ